jgi:hypothetical protein
VQGWAKYDTISLYADEQYHIDSDLTGIPWWASALRQRVLRAGFSNIRQDCHCGSVLSPHTSIQTCRRISGIIRHRCIFEVEDD